MISVKREYFNPRCLKIDLTFFISRKKYLDKVQNVSQFKKIDFDVVLVNSLSTMNFELSVL